MADPFKTIVAVSVTVFVLLLIAPWTPPPIALFGAIGVFMLAVSVYFGGSFIVRELYTGWTEAAPEEEADPIEELREQYAAGEMSEEEYERAVERELESEHE